MSKKIKLTDLKKDTFVWSNPDIIDITFSNSNIDLENGHLTQKTKIKIDKDLEINSVLGAGTTLYDHHSVVPVPEDSDIYYRQEAHKKSNYYSLNDQYGFGSLEYYEFFQNKLEIQMPSLYTSKRDYFNKEEFDQYTHFSSNFNKEKMLHFKDKLEPFYLEPSNESLIKYQKFFFGKNYDHSIANSNISSFPYSVKINFSLNNNPLSLPYLDSEYTKIYDKLVADYDSAEKIDASFIVNNVEALEFKLVDFLTLLRSSPKDHSSSMLSLPSQNSISKIEEAAFRWSAHSVIYSSILNNIRDFKDIYNKQPCKSEVFFYKVDKYIGESVLATPYQTYYVNNPDQDILMYDTQVKLNGTYTYAVKAYFLVYGSEYFHSIQNNVLIDDFREVTFNTIIRPSAKIIEVPLFTKTVVVSKNPPLPPSAIYVNKSNAQNKIKVILSLQNGSMISPFLPVKDTDGEYVRKLKSVNKSALDTVYLFEHSHQRGRFEVFKSRRRIDKYIYQESFIAENKTGRPHVILSEKVIPNKKYYYFFRTIDDYGFASNPSPIYEVELQKDSDSSKLIVNTVEIYNEDEHLFTPDKKFGQFIQIQPTYEQTQITPDGFFDYSTYKGQLGNVALGQVGVSVWGKKFKFRITSNNTGKKIDFNLIFDITKKQSEENLK